MNTAADISNLQHAARGRARAPSRLADYLELTKPRMNFLVVITTMVGYYMAARGLSSHRTSDWLRLFHTLLGTAATAASAAALNHLLERRFDAMMRRTANRPLPAGRVSPTEALTLGVATGVFGVAYLAILVNPLTAILGGATLLAYVLIYTPLKRYTTLNTVIGAFPGAIPTVMGWTAYHNALSPEALVLFGILFLWQMPHFLAIAILYKDDYARGGFKMLPVLDEDLTITGRQIILYTLALLPVTLLPTAMGMAGIAYFAAALLLGLAFLSFGASAAATRTRTDARKLFFSSIIYLPVLFAAMMIDKL